MAPPPDGAAGAPAAKGGDGGAALARATLAQLRPGAVRYDLSVPAQLLHPASALQLYGALLGASLAASSWLRHPPRHHPRSERNLGARSAAAAPSASARHRRAACALVPD
jgi:hypothetical protein